MRESFIEWRPTGRSKELIGIINIILADFKQQGYKLTLRQLYYQLVAGDHIPNSQREYKKIGNVVNKGRLAGFIDWAMIEDRVRAPKSNVHWDSPKQILETAARSYYEGRWDLQDCYVEVWCEKDAVSNIIQPVCSLWDVTFLANRGYSSQSALYEAADRFKTADNEGKLLHLIYLGDHDPSGMDMTRDVTDRMELFLGDYLPITVDRIALNMDQVTKYNPPENPAKQTDSRFKNYEELYGNASWELDALQPSVLSAVVEDAITLYVDDDLWDEAADREAASKQKLQDIINNA